METSRLNAAIGVAYTIVEYCEIDIGEICGMDENLVYDPKQCIKMLSKTMAA